MNNKLIRLGFSLCFFVGGFLIPKGGHAFSGAANANLPKCEIDPAHIDNGVGKAGCFVQVGSKVLMVRQLSGKLNTPGGRGKKKESAQCTAHRETWEEAGVEVRVGKRLKKYKSGFFLFRCQLVKQPSFQEDNLPVPIFAFGEITEVKLIDLAKLKKKQLRFPKQLKDLKKFLVSD